MNKKPKILVVGSFVMDQIVTTDIFPRQGQTVLGNSFSKAPGGKGANQAVQASLLGADVTFVGKLGNDSNGEELLAACRNAGVDTSKVIIDKDGVSGCAVIILENMQDGSTQNRIMVISGTNMTIAPEEVVFLKEEIAEYDLVILQLEIPMEINELVAEYAHEKGVPVILNPAPSAPLSDSLLSHLAFVTPNEHEVEDLTGIHIQHDENGLDMETAKAAAAALKEKGAANVLITLGSAGVLVMTEDNEYHYAPCTSGITAVDPTAAGDSFIGSFSVGYCSGWSWEEILLFANRTAAITVSGMGAMPSLPNLQKVVAFIQNRGESCPDISALR